MFFHFLFFLFKKCFSKNFKIKHFQNFFFTFSNWILSKKYLSIPLFFSKIFLLKSFLIFIFLTQKNSNKKEKKMCFFSIWGLSRSINFHISKTFYLQILSHHSFQVNFWIKFNNKFSLNILIIQTFLIISFVSIQLNSFKFKFNIE